MIELREFHLKHNEKIMRLSDTDIDLNCTESIYSVDATQTVQYST